MGRKPLEAPVELASSGRGMRCTDRIGHTAGYMTGGNKVLLPCASGSEGWGPRAPNKAWPPDQLVCLLWVMRDQLFKKSLMT